MASSPETAQTPESTPISSPPPSPPLRQNPSLTIAALPDPTPPDHAAPIPSLPPGQAAEKYLEADEQSVAAPIDGNPRGAGPPPSLSPRELATSASPALEVAKSEEPTSPSPPPLLNVVEVSPETEAAAASPPPSPQIAEALPEDAPPPSPPPSPPASTSGALLDASSTDSAAMASEEAARPPPAPDSMDADPHTAPAPPTPPLESGPEDLLPQHHPRPPFPTVHPGCGNSEPAQLPPPPPTPAETTDALTDAAETDAAAVTPEEAAGSPPALKATDGETDTAPAVTPAFESNADGSLQEPVPRPPSPPMEAEPCSPEMDPPEFYNFNSSWLPLPPPTLLAETTHSLLDAAATEAVAVPKEAAGSLPVSEAMDIETETTSSLPPPSSESEEEGILQQSLLRPPSPIMQAEPCSPGTPPPGFENFKSAWPVPALEKAMDKATDTEPVVLPPFESDVEGLLQESVLRPSSPPMEAQLCLSELPPSSFENLKSKCLPLPPPTLPVETAHSLLDAAPLLRPPSPIMQAEQCSPDTPPPGFENFKLAWPVPALEAIDVEKDTTHSLLQPLESRVEGLSQQSLLRPPNPMAESSSCSLEMAPPGFENFKSSWTPLPTPLARSAYALPDAAATESLAVTLEEAARIPPALDAMDVDMDATHPLLLPLESGVEGPLQEPLPRPPSHIIQDAPGSPDMAPPGFEDFNSSQILLPSPPLERAAHNLHDPATTEAISVTEEAARTPPALEAMDVNMDTAPALQPSSESGAEGLFPHQLPRLRSPKDKGTACSPEMVPSGHENLESSQLLPLPALLSQVQTADALADVIGTETVVVALEEVPVPPPVSGAMEECTVPILPPPLKSYSEGSLPQLDSHAHSLTAQAVDILPDAPATKSLAVKSELTAQPPPTLQATDTTMDSATTSLPLSESGAEVSLPQPQHQPPSPSAQAAPCSLDSLQLLPPPPPPPFLDQEMGQMVCGSCRDLLAYPRGALHVQCAGCQTINLVLEAHEVGKVSCGRCETLLMYPFGAPAVKCSLCLFVTEIGERNVRPRISPEQIVPPHPQELTNQG